MISEQSFGGLYVALVKESASWCTIYCACVDYTAELYDFYFVALSIRLCSISAF